MSDGNCDGGSFGRMSEQPNLYVAGERIKDLEMCRDHLKARIAELEAALGKPLSEMVALHHEWQESILKLERENARLKAILTELRQVSPSWNDWVNLRI